MKDMSSNVYSIVLFDPESCTIAANEKNNEFQFFFNYAYGIVLPTICFFGIIGNILNIVVLCRKNTNGATYVYMRGYSVAALIAIVFALPFAFRIIVHQDSGTWNSYATAFYFSHLELFLGNSCLGIGVMMLLSLTLERYFAVCRPAKKRPIFNTTCTLFFITFGTIILYIPSMFKNKMILCQTENETNEFYLRKENTQFVSSLFFTVYKVIIELMFKVVPTILIAGFNFQIIRAYKKSCKRRKEITLHHLKTDVEIQGKLSDEKRILFLLGSTSLLFLICVSPMVVLNITLSQTNLDSFNYQIFRAMANLLELLNYSITFYIYCLFSEDFRRTFIAVLKCQTDRRQSSSNIASLAVSKKTTSKTIPSSPRYTS